MMKKGKLLFTIKPHSFVGEITNSSTELFCTVSGKSKEFIEEGLQGILKEFGCSAVSFQVENYEYENENEDWVVDPNKFSIWYDYEINHEPCKMMKKRILELFETVEEN